MNRISRTILRFDTIIADWPKEKIEERRKGLDMNIKEYVLCQELKSLACLHGVLSIDEGMSMYHILGESLEHFNVQPYTHKAVVTLVYKELLDKRLTGTL